MVGGDCVTWHDFLKSFGFISHIHQVKGPREVFGNRGGLLPEGGIRHTCLSLSGQQIGFLFLSFFFMPLAQGFLLEAGELQLLTAVLAGALKVWPHRPDRSEGKTHFPGEKSLT